MHSAEREGGCAMEDGIMVRKVLINCPLCGKRHEVNEITRGTETLVKGELTSYVERVFCCVDTNEEENEFETSSMTNENLMNARDAYRMNHDLLTSKEIVEIRENYGLSQVDMARMLGWGEATISRYESKAIQDEAYDTMLRLVRDNPLKAMDLLKHNRKAFTEAKYETIKAHIIEKMDSFGKEYLSREALKAEYVRFDEPSEYNGYTTLNIDKIEAIVSYYAETISRLFKVKLMKLLWYADALQFKKTGHAITGLVYCHEPMGALPIGHNDLMNLERLNVKEEWTVNYDYMLHIYPIKGIDYTILSKDDLDILDAVIMKFKDFNAAEISDYMHKEVAYLNTNKNEIIPFKLAGQIKEF